jgi:hypothetical protein
MRKHHQWNGSQCRKGHENQYDFAEDIVYLAVDVFPVAFLSAAVRRIG